MGELFDRVVRLQLVSPNGDARELTGLRMAFRVNRTSTSRADDADLSVWGLSSSTAGELEDEKTVVRLIAGYQGSGVGQIITGTVVPGSLKRPSQGAETITSWQVSEHGVDLSSVVLSDSWGSSVTTRAVLERIASLLGLSLGQTTLAADVTYARGYVLQGTARKALTELAQDAKSRWTIQAGRLVLLPLSGSVRVRASVLSTATGLIGTPDAVDAKRIRVTALLRPALVPGDRIRIESDRYRGDYVIQDVMHVGDSGYAAPYYTTITCKAE